MKRITQKVKKKQYIKPTEVVITEVVITEVVITEVVITEVVITEVVINDKGSLEIETISPNIVF